MISPAIKITNLLMDNYQKMNVEVLELFYKDIIKLAYKIEVINDLPHFVNAVSRKHEHS